MIDSVIRFLDEQGEHNLSRLKELLCIPSISTDPAHRADVHRAATWLHEFFASCGMRSRIIETRGHPCLLADSGPEEHTGPTLLVYGHYDVQPVGDESLWQSPPFEPSIRDGSIFARGAADDKGQLFTHLLAAEAWLKTTGSLPVRVKYLIEGEEEISSPNLEPVVRSNRAELACDCVVISDGSKFDARVPAITYAARGFVGKEVILLGPRQDLHSGEYGGAVMNPGNALALIIASMHDAANRVTLPGFYDDVQALDAEERARLEELPFDEAAFLSSTGSPRLAGEVGYSTRERCWVRPTLEVSGIRSGYAGDGFSSIIPAKASAKISMRLVPHQDPRKISQAFDDAVRRSCPPGVRLEILDHGSFAPYVAPTESPGISAGANALEAGFGQPPLFIRGGGTLPALPLFKELLDADTLMLGFSVPDCNAHGPNEFLVLSDFHRGAHTVAHLLDRLAQL